MKTFTQWLEAIRDVSDLPDDRVPAWVLRSRNARRYGDKLLCSCNLHFATRGQVLAHCDGTGHKPMVTTPDDAFIKRTPWN